MVKGTIHKVNLLVYNGLTLIMNGWVIICNFSIENFMQSHISPTAHNTTPTALSFFNISFAFYTFYSLVSFFEANIWK